MNRISRTLALAKASWRVLRADRELLWLPVLSGAASVVAVLTFVSPLVLGGGAPAATDPGPAGYVLLFTLYVVLATITIFSNTALVHAANERLDGGDPTVGSALRGATARLGRIIPWALVSATVSVVLRAIEERAGFAGRLVAGLAGVAWSLVTFLVIPVFVIEDVGVVEAVKRSGALFKRTWGENVAAQVGFGLLGFLAAMLAAPLIALGAAAGGTGAVLGIGLGVLWVALVAVVISALTAVFQTALYRYAVEGEVPSEFEPAALRAAFAPRGGGGFGGRRGGGFGGTRPL